MLSFPEAILILLRFYVKGIQTVSPKALNHALPHVTGEIVGVFDAESALSSKGAFGHGGGGYGEAYMSGYAF